MKGINLNTCFTLSLKFCKLLNNKQYSISYSQDDMAKRYNLVSLLILLIGLAVTYISYYEFEKLNNDKIASIFKGEIDDRASSFHRELSDNIEGLFAAKDILTYFDLNYASYKKIVSGISNRHRNIEYIAWIPRINKYQVDTFKVIARKQFWGFKLKEVSKNNTIIPVGRYNEYYPFYYIFPKKMQKNLLGISLYPAEPVFRKLVKITERYDYRAIKDMPSLRPNLKDNQFILFFPVYSPRKKTELKGFLSAAIDIGGIFANSISQDHLTKLNITLRDVSEPKNPITIYTNAKRSVTASNKEYHINKKLLDFGGRSIEILAYPTNEYLSSVRNLSPYIVLIASILITLILVVLIRRIMLRSVVIKEQNDELTFTNHQLSQLSNTDPLTGLANRRHFDQVLEQEWKRSVRESNPITLLMIDIDHFKLYNDTYGHLNGDKCLKNVAKALSRVTSRPTDLVARYGGEEFAIILSNTEDRAGKVAIKCVKEINNLHIPHKSSLVSDHVTISVGSATFAISPEAPQKILIQKADKALYAAKKDGRNRVKIIY